MPAQMPARKEPDNAVNAAREMLQHFQDRHDPADLDRAEHLLRGFIAAATRDHPMLPSALSTLSQLVVHRVREADDRGSLDEAVAIAQEAAGLVAPDDPVWPHFQAHLGWILCQRYEDAGVVSDLDAGARCAADALAATPDGHPDRPTALNTLAYSHRLRYDRFGQVSDADSAVRFARQALAGETEQDLQQVAQSLLATSLASRFVAAGDPADADEAVRLCRIMLADLPDTHIDRVVVQANFAYILLQRHVRGGDPADLREATQLGQHVISALPAYPRMRSLFLSNHAAVLFGHFVSQDSPGHVAEALRVAEQAVTETAHDDPRHAIHRVNLANIMVNHARLTKDPSGVEAAIRIAREALARLSPGNPDRTRALGVLATSVRVRGMITGDRSDLDTAAGLWRSAVSSRVGATEVRMAAGQAWADAAATAGEADLAVEAYGAAIGLLPVLAWRGLDRAAQERRLARVVGLGSDAAAWALTAGQPRRAVEFLEQGRQVLWSQAVQTRSDLSALAAVAPALAEELDRTRLALDRGMLDTVFTGPGLTGTGLELMIGRVGTGDGSDDADLRRRLAERWERLLEEVRRRPGFGDFLASTPFDRLRQAASDGPVVLVNTTRWRSDALIVTTTGVHPVALPWLDHDTAQQRAAALLAAQREAEAGSGGLARAHLRHTLTSTLRWLWDTVAEPVCAALDEILAGRDILAGEAARDRLWWCPTGPLTMLPLHAAGRYGAPAGLASRRRPTVPARYVCSYTPSLGTLLRARAAPAAVAPPRVFAVGLTRTAGQAPLPEVAEELRVISTHLAGVRLLTGPAATRAAVLDALARHNWVHVACHAVQDFDRPSASALQLVDGRLSVLDLGASPALAARLAVGGGGSGAGGGAELAYLSACRTAAGGQVLPDEAIHLTAALQLAGYRHVIGSQWAVSDRIAAQVAGDVYARLGAAPGGPDAAGAARALDAALVRVRSDHPDRPELWASLIHTGP